MTDFRYWLPFATLGGGLLLAVLIGNALDGTRLLTLVVLAINAVTPVAGVSVWIRKGHSWLATLTWTIPLGVILVGVVVAPDVPRIVRLMVAEIGVLFGVGMIVFDEMAAWWYRRILRSPPPKLK